jgi:hypothetical protein
VNDQYQGLLNIRFQQLNKWYLLMVREAAMTDLVATQVATGLPRSFLMLLAEQSVASVEAAADRITAVVFTARFRRDHLERLFTDPESVSDSILMSGLDSN